MSARTCAPDTMRVHAMSIGTHAHHTHSHAQHTQHISPIMHAPARAARTACPHTCTCVTCLCACVCACVCARVSVCASLLACLILLELHSRQPHLPMLSSAPPALQSPATPRPRPLPGGAIPPDAPQTARPPD